MKSRPTFQNPFGKEFQRKHSQLPIERVQDCFNEKSISVLCITMHRHCKGRRMQSKSSAVQSKRSAVQSRRSAVKSRAFGSPCIPWRNRLRFLFYRTTEWPGSAGCPRLVSRLCCLLLFALGACSPSSAEPAGAPSTYFVDSRDGDDANSGLSESEAWRTLERLNRGEVNPGSTVLFRRARVYRGQLLPVSGTSEQPTRYGAYGSGGLPELRGSVDVSSPSGWVERPPGSGIWAHSQVFDTDVGNLIFDEGASFGQKRWSAAELSEEDDYFFDRDKGELQVLARRNPGLTHLSVEAALRKNIVHFQGRAHLVFEGLAVRYGAAHGFGGGTTRDITIRACEVSYVGGGDLDMDGSNVRFGNGIEFWGDARDHLVEDNTIFEIYDTALSNQNHTKAVVQRNITYRNNLIYNTGMASFECWNRPGESTTEAIVFEFNTAVGAGEGWGAPPQRPDEQGVHILLAYNPAKTSDVVIHNNVFSGGNLALWVAHAAQWQAALSLDFNCYHQPQGDLVLINGAADAGVPQTFGSSDLAQWAAVSGADEHSLMADPLFNDPLRRDYGLQSDSPCRRVGSVGQGAGAGI